MSIWAKYVLGWVDPSDNLAVLDVNDLGKDPLVLRMEQSEFWGGSDNTINAIRISLPDKAFYVNDPDSGVLESFGGKADEIDTTLRRSVDLTGLSSAELSFWTWYEIEDNWDFGFVQVSTDGGSTWTSLPVDGTTMSCAGCDGIDRGQPARFHRQQRWLGQQDLRSGGLPGTDHRTAVPLYDRLGYDLCRLLPGRHQRDRRRDAPVHR